MINPIPNQSDVFLPMTQPKGMQAAPAKQHQLTEDSVVLSPQAKAAASGDIDHDGDSH